MTTILRVVALVCFAIAAFVCLFVEGPDVFDALAAISLGLACWVAATLVP